jgi:cupin 2 domain-containing protein
MVEGFEPVDHDFNDWSNPVHLNHIFSGIPELMKDEIFENLLETDHFRLERIVSSGQSTSSGEWYDQDANEWVILLSGSASLLFEGQTEELILYPGDYVHIPAHRRHRVKWTDKNQKTVWLTLHYY